MSRIAVSLLSSRLPSFAALCAFVVVGACRCGPFLPDPPAQCDANGIGCLSDEQCVNGKCQPLPKCTSDKDCKSAAFSCAFPAQVCTLREGFGEECNKSDAPCPAGQYCALGICYPSSGASALEGCSHDSDCPFGFKCDRLDNGGVCIEAADCRLAAQGFPELACDTSQQQTCDETSGQCVLPCQNQCTTDNDCASQGGGRCNGSCQCVGCLTNADCGTGTHCERNGQCISDNSCRSASDCTSGFVCGASGLCEAPPPPCASDFDCALGDKCDVASGQCFHPLGQCTLDAAEPSNTPAQAHAFTLDANGDGGEDHLELCPNDDDVYSVAILAGDLLTVTVTVDDPRARATMWLLDSSGETSIAFSETPPRGPGVIKYVAQSDETVYIRLTALVQETGYAIALHVDHTGTTCNADAFEGAGGNDTIATATPPGSFVEAPASNIGTICPGDVDIFHVAVNAGEALTATLSFDGTQTDLDVAFLDAEGNLLGQAAGTGEPEVLRQRFQNATDVYVRVRGFGNDTGDYTLSLQRDPPFVCAPDAREPDNDVAHAVVIAKNAGLAPEARTMCAGDEDWLVTPLEDFEKLVVSATYQQSDVTLQIDVLDATGTTVLASSPPESGGAAIAFDSPGNQTVAVRIKGVANAVGPYTLSVTKENQNDCTPDAFEPNDTVATASTTLPQPGQILSMCTSDEDFFQFNGHAGKKLVADASFREVDADIDLQLIGLDGVQILATADGSGDGEHLEAILPLDGTYTLRVFSLTSPANARYELSVSEQSP